MFFLPTTNNPQLTTHHSLIFNLINSLQFQNLAGFIRRRRLQAVFPAVADHRLQGARRGHDSGSRVLIQKVLDSVDVI